MPNQCIHCSRIIPVGSEEIFKGCSSCHGKFFFYIRDEQIKKIKEKSEFVEPLIPGLETVNKKQVESDVRSILKIEDEAEPVILDLESVRVLAPGKFELDLVSLINRKPIVFKLSEGKYIIDIEGM